MKEQGALWGLEVEVLVTWVEGLGRRLALLVLQYQVGALEPLPCPFTIVNPGTSIKCWFKKKTKHFFHLYDN